MAKILVQEIVVNERKAVQPMVGYGLASYISEIQFISFS